MLRGTALLLLAWLTAACDPAPDPADPALWEVTAPGGQRGWLFGTVHALPAPAKWDTPPVATALAEADLLMVEIADVGDSDAIGKVFARLSVSRNPLPPLTTRVEPAARGDLRTALDRHGLSDSQFAHLDTWAAALTLAQAAAPDIDKRYGIDGAVLDRAGERPVVELEGTEAQLAIFDRLPEAEQADLLEAVARDAASLAGESADLMAAWRRGDMAVIERETTRGLLADPELREALFTARNAAWTTRIGEAIAQGREPFVAVGAAHMAGPEGLPAMLEAEGFAVRRVR